MTRIAIVGAGQTGASAALALVQQGVEVTLFSDRDQQALRNSVPATGTAVLFGGGQQAERHLGLRSYQDVAPLGSGMSQRIVAEPNVELIAFDATFDGFTGEGVDTRLKADDRINGISVSRREVRRLRSRRRCARRYRGET
jgi:2-polyprenyl-6-methoxyphenol hydroxylase-like FAD-dependent oxidoreductase